MGIFLTSTVAALHHLAIVRHAGISQALQVVLVISRPSLTKIHPVSLVRKEKADNVSAVQLALKINDAHDIDGILVLFSKLVVIRCSPGGID